MSKLTGRFYRTFEKKVPELIFDHLLVRNLAMQNIHLPKAVRKKIFQNARAGGSSFTMPGEGQRRITLEFTAEDAELAEQMFDKVVKKIPEITAKATAQTAEQLFDDLVKDWPRESRSQKAEIAGFQRRLERRWRKPLELLRMMQTISLQYGAILNPELRRTLGREKPHLVHVLLGLHARGCQVASEIITLLSAGFADGAMARWRTLHEIAVVAYFVSEHDEDTAERYVHHQVVEAVHANKAYQSCHERLGYDPIDEKELREMVKRRDVLIDRYGAHFGHAYGWAADHFEKKKTRFEDLERAVKIDHFFAHFKMASYNVHADPRGIFFRHGILGDVKVLLCGPSNAGLHEPGQLAAISLLHITCALANLEPTLEGNACLLVVQRLVRDIKAAFSGCGDKLEEDSKPKGSRARRTKRQSDK